MGHTEYCSSCRAVFGIDTLLHVVGDSLYAKDEIEEELLLQKKLSSVNTAWMDKVVIIDKQGKQISAKGRHIGDDGADFPEISMKRYSDDVAYVVAHTECVRIALKYIQKYNKSDLTSKQYLYHMLEALWFIFPEEAVKVFGFAYELDRQTPEHLEIALKHLEIFSPPEGTTHGSKKNRKRITDIIQSLVSLRLLEHTDFWKKIHTRKIKTPLW